MKREMGLIRELLLKLEPMGSSHQVLTFTADDEELAVKGYKEEEIEYHLALIWEEGLVESGSNSSGRMASGEFMFRRLTWKGHEFVDAVRDEEVWRQTKAGASKIGSMTFDVVKNLAIAYAKQKAKEKLGIEL
jgi:hypothetical protein